LFIGELQNLKISMTRGYSDAHFEGKEIGGKTSGGNKGAGGGKKTENKAKVTISKGESNLARDELQKTQPRIE